MERLKDFLKQRIEEKGYDSVTFDPEDLYRELIANDFSTEMAAAVFTIVANGVSLYAQEHETTEEELTAMIQKRCFFRKKEAAAFAKMLVALYSDENFKQWESRELEGFREFASKEWEFEWEGRGDWDAGGTTLECFANAKITYTAEDPEGPSGKLMDLLQDNPFITVEDIRRSIEDEMANALEEDMEDFINADDLYEPAMSDFHSDGIKEICEEYGLELVDEEYGGDTGDFEPKGRWWY